MWHQVFSQMNHPTIFNRIILKSPAVSDMCLSFDIMGIYLHHQKRGGVLVSEISLQQIITTANKIIAAEENEIMEEVAKEYIGSGFEKDGITAVYQQLKKFIDDGGTGFDKGLSGIRFDSRKKINSEDPLVIQLNKELDNYYEDDKSMDTLAVFDNVRVVSMGYMGCGLTFTLPNFDLDVPSVFIQRALYHSVMDRVELKLPEIEDQWILKSHLQ